MSEKRRGLGKGLGALIPSGPQAISHTERPVDLLFRDRPQDGLRGNRNPLFPTSAPEVESPEAPSSRTGSAETAEGVAEARLGPDAAEQSGRRGQNEAAEALTSPEPGSADEPPVADRKEGTSQQGAQESEPRSATSGLPGGEGLTDHPATHRERLQDESLPADAVVSRETSAVESRHDASGEVVSPREVWSPEEVSQDAASSVNHQPAAASPDLVHVPGASFREIPVSQIRANPRQPRTVFDEEALDELQQSITQVGVLQPIVVREVAGEDGFELIMGERRWRACQAAGLERVPAIVRVTSDDDLLRDALLENLHRSNLNPLEEAAAYDQLLNDFGCTHDELAGRIGRSRPQISNTIRLLRLPALVQRRVAAGVLSSGHARALLSLADPAAMERLAQRIVAEGLSVRATEEIVAMGAMDTERPQRRRTQPQRLNSEALEAITTRLSDVLETRVSAAMSRRKGRLTIEFADLDDLERILAELVPGGEGTAEQSNGGGGE